MIGSDDAAEILARLEVCGIEVWVDGGWGVDALLGEQTRAHDDLDLVIARGCCAAARDGLAPPSPLPHPDLQVRHHLGHEPDAADHHDMHQLAERFQLELPSPYDKL